MANLNVSAAHSLQLVPVERLSKFARINSGVKLVCLRQPDEADAIPGSLRITATEEDGIIKKSITYKRRTVDRKTADLLESYRFMRLVAIYIDETGSQRVSGSPDYPLKFSYTSGEGVYTCTLEGEGLTIDPFLI